MNHRLLVATLSLCACGKEVGRVAFSAEGTGSTTATLAAGDVAFWSDLDLDYEGSAALGYAVELKQGGAPVATVTCNPLGHMSVKTGWVETNLGSSHSRSGNGKMDCSATLAKGGPTDVTVSLGFSTRPAKVTLKKADLVLKQ